MSGFGFPLRVSRGLLHDKPVCSHVEPDAVHFRPEAFTGALSVNSGSDACPLARRPADNNLRAAEAPPSERSDVVMDRNSGELLRQDGPAPFVDLAQSDRADAGPRHS